MMPDHSQRTPEQQARARDDATTLRVGDPVRHTHSGWTGTVAAIREDDSGMRGSQGPLVTVDPVYAGGKKWNAMTVTADELMVIGRG